MPRLTDMADANHLAEWMYRTSRRFNDLARTLGELVLPRRCVSCRSGLPADSMAFCPLCEPTVEALDGPGCPGCALPRRTVGGSAEDGVDELCHRCLTRRPPQRMTRARWRYGGALADALKAAKYGGEPWRLEPIARRLAPWLARVTESVRETWDAPTPLWCPVPAHPSSCRRRGFYPAAMLLRLAARYSDLEVRYDAVSKVRQTLPQAELARSERRKNVRGAYRAADMPEDSTWILFDDVLTTGATAAEVASTLLGAGAQRVAVVVAARAVPEW